MLIEGVEAKAIEGFEGYFVTVKGDVYSTRIKSIPQKRKMQISKTGYCSIILQLKEGYKRKYVHRLVAQTFLLNPKNKRTVNHIDGNKLNNNLDNLEYTTYAENLKHARDTGLSKLKGSSNPGAKLKEKEVIEIKKLLATGITQTAIAKQFNICDSLVCLIKKGQRWGHI